MKIRFSEIKKNALLFLLSTLVMFLILEIFLRRFSPQISEHDAMFQPDPALGWKFIPNKKGTIVYYDEVQNVIETNALGFRDDVSLPLSHEKMIMVIGDSFVSNISVKDDEVFTEVMEEGAEALEVLNFGVNGYGQVQERLVLRQWLPEIKPDLVIAMIYIRNDFAENMAGGKWLYPRPTVRWLSEQASFQYNPPKAAQKPNAGKSIFKAYEKVHLYHFVRKKLRNINDKLDKEKANSIIPPELYLCKSDLAEEIENMYVVMEKMLLEIHQETIKAGIPIVFSLAPSIAQVEDDLWESLFDGRKEKPSDYKKSLPNDRLMEFAKANNLNMIDLLPALQKEASRGEVLYNPLEQHWTAEGNKIVAVSLLEYLKTNGFID